MIDTGMKTVALLCDVPGLWWASNRFAGKRVDYAALRRRVGAGRIFDADPIAWLQERPGLDLDKFRAYLAISSYETRLVKQGFQIDSLISAAAIELARTNDVIAIAASAGNYQLLAEQLRQSGKELEIWAFPVRCLLDEMNGRADRWNQLGDQVLLAS